MSLSDLRVESRTSMDATWSAHYIPIAPMPTRTRRESRHLNKERACCSCGMRSMLILPVMILLLSRPSLAAKGSPGGSACTTQSEQATERAAITPVTCDEVHCRRRWVHDWVEKREAFGSFAYLACTCHLNATTRRHDLGLHLNHVSATDLPVFANSILLTDMVPDRYTQFPIPKAYRAKAT